jgi:hypothetical protein
MSVLMPVVGPLVAARAYLLEELAARDNPLPVGITPPGGQPQSYALLSRPGSVTREFLADYMIRVRVFDGDAVQLERNADLLYRLMLEANHRLIYTSLGSMWVTGATDHMGPATFNDGDVPLFGMQFAVHWTVGLHPEAADDGS